MAHNSNNIITDDADPVVSKRTTLFDARSGSDPRYAALGAWFLGPKAENAGLFKELVELVLGEHFNYRHDYFPQDPKYITAALKATDEFQGEVIKMKEEAKKIADALKDSIPFFSMRYQGHMLWDVTLPAMIGYIAALPYNQNNTAAEASPVTTVFEKQVGDDLATLLGFDIKNPVKPWGHITCDGTVANIESMWAARNLKFQAIAFREALKDPALSDAVTMTVPVWEGLKKVDKTILDLDNWTLLNLDVDDILNLTIRIQDDFGIPANIVKNAMAPYNVQQLGYAGAVEEFGIKKLPVIFISSTAHYSWPKAAAVLGIGMKQLILIPVDVDGRMDLKLLEANLIKCAENQIPVMQVVAVTGSTEESCMDPLDDIIKLRDMTRSKLGLNFYIHADGAWGGYFATMLRNGNNPPEPTDSALLKQSAYVPYLPLSAEVERHIIAFKNADSVTIDPHKSGLIPYPAGGLVYRNGSTRYLLTFDAPIVFKGATDPTIGIYGIEGSKPGAAATAVHLSHKVIPTNKDGYGRILGEANFSCKKMHCILQTLAADDDPFIIVPFNRLPGEVENNPVKTKEEKEFIRARINGKTNEQIVEDKEALDFLRNIGPDLIINAFSINFKIPDAQGNFLQMNKDVNKVNALITTMFNDLNLLDIFQLQPPDSTTPISPMSRFGVQRKPLFFTNSTFGNNKYGAAVQSIKNRLQLEHAEQSSLNFLVNTVMDPWPTSPQFFDKVVRQQLRKSILSAIGTVTDQPDIHGFLNAPQYTDDPDQKLYHKHFPMFHAAPHQYMVTVVADFIDPNARKAYFQKAKENPDQLMVWANHDPLILHDWVYTTPTTGFWCDHYCGLPASGPPDIPFMSAQMYIQDVIIFEHFDQKAVYPSRLTYLVYGSKGKYHMEHYITQAPNWDNMLDVEVHGIDDELLELGVYVKFDIPDPGADIPSQSPLEQGRTYNVVYTARDAQVARAKITVTNNFWFNNQRVNVASHSEVTKADGSVARVQACCFKNLNPPVNHTPTNL